MCSGRDSRSQGWLLEFHLGKWDAVTLFTWGGPYSCEGGRGTRATRDACEIADYSRPRGMWKELDKGHLYSTRVKVKK